MQQTYIQATFTMHKISNCCNYSHAKTMDAEMWLRTTLRLRYKRTSRVFPQKKIKTTASLERVSEIQRVRPKTTRSALIF